MANPNIYLKKLAQAVNSISQIEPPQQQAQAIPDPNKARMAKAVEAISQIEPGEPEARAADPAREKMSRAVQNISQMEPERAPSIHSIKNGLNGGEISPELGSRFDQQRYVMGCHELLNFVPLPWGGVVRRPPMEFRAFANGRQCRLIPFVFSRDESRLLELSYNGRSCDLRVFDTEGNLIHADFDFAPIDYKIISELTYCQSADVIFIAHRSLYPHRIERHADNDWRFVEIDFMPEIPAPTWHEYKAEGTSNPNETKLVTYEYVATAISEETGEESMPSEVAVIKNTLPLTDAWYVRLDVNPVEGADEYRFYRKSAGVFGFVGQANDPEEITYFDHGQKKTKTIYRFEDKNVEPDTSDTPPRFRDPFEKEDERPALVFLHQQRLGFASSKGHPMTIWMTQTGNYESMAASIPPDDDDAIEATLAAPEANSILWAESDRNGLLLGTQAGEWNMVPGEGNALTPTDLSFEPQCNYGSAEGLKPIRASAGLIFAQRGGRVIRDLGYSFQEDRYAASDLSILARHIFDNRRIVSWAWQQEPWAVLWLALSDGTLAGLTYQREFEVMAWHRHETAGQVLQLCPVPAQNGETNIFMLVDRGPSISIEKFKSITNPSADSLYVDGPMSQPFESRLSPCVSEEIGQGNSTFLMLKKINSIKIKVRNSFNFKARVTGQDVKPTEWFDVKKNAPFTTEAIWPCHLMGGWREGARLEFLIDHAGPVSINSILINYEVSDMAGGNAGAG